MKWLCGGPGNGWLYVRPDLAEPLEPTSTGWQAHARPFAFEEEMEYAAGAARFLTGTPNVPAHYAGDRGLRPRRGDRRRADPRELAPPDAAPDRPRRRGRVRGREPARGGAARRVGRPRASPSSRPCTRSSRRAAILCDFRPDAGIRLGPHFFNTDDELRFAVEQIAEILETGAYERHRGAVALH